MVTRPIAWHSETRLWLSLEDYTNAGLSQERMIEAIASMPDAGSASMTLRASPMRINGNIIVATFLTDREALQLCVDRIQCRLDLELAELHGGDR